MRVGPIPAPAGEPSTARCSRRARWAYPRTCGGATGAGKPACAAMGLSPHLRGSRRHWRAHQSTRWPIPAPAGEPLAGDAPRPRCMAYPRTCGGAWRWGVGPLPGHGLSPHLRGSHHCGQRRPRIQRPIPAPAGEPALHRPPDRRPTAYPRTCGGANRAPGWRKSCRGLSPHLRGSRRANQSVLAGRGPIPAPAGEPCPSRPTRSSWRAYPRTCGGASDLFPLKPGIPGLSPHLRGSPITPRPCPPAGGPIPAPAGEPQQDVRQQPRQGAYPRTCGGAVKRWVDPASIGGLSPHLRGSLLEDIGRRVGGRPIPAPAGEPRNRDGPRGYQWAYPRTCGGACAAVSRDARKKGLSPHLRGSRRRAACSRGGSWPIPAPAGEPDRCSVRSWKSWAYPRTCGGALSDAEMKLVEAGLSPHLRGSRVSSFSGVRVSGPIPAPAGEPETILQRQEELRAYPRTCGGARIAARGLRGDPGLSPHLRGSLTHAQHFAVRDGPIPAPAGEPIYSSISHTARWAYPRTCGGAGVIRTTPWAAMGLSPRLRGSRHRRGRSGRREGPIPAPAGEPRAARSTQEE